MAIETTSPQNGSMNSTISGLRMGQLLQVWRDYYDEILDVNTEDGSFETMMGRKDLSWAASGFAGIEVILLAEKSVHPDDKENFKTFFDIDRIVENSKNGIFVTKLNFRFHRSDSDEYTWVKVKNIVPTKQVESGPLHFFACFRRVDKEANDDIQYRHEMADSLARANEALAKKNDLLARLFKEVRSPLNGILGMIGLTLNECPYDETTLDRLERIESETIRLSNALTGFMREYREDEDGEQVAETELPKVNRISYVKREEALSKDSDPNNIEADIPENYIYESKPDSALSTASSKERSFDFHGKRILVVEDNELNLEVLKELIESTGASVDTAMDGKQAVVRFVSKPAGTYDLILMDIDIPVLDGYSAARCIRICGKDDCSTVPIYAVTSNNFVEDINKSVECGFNAFFAKPVDFSVLFTKIEDELYRQKGENS